MTDDRQQPLDSPFHKRSTAVEVAEAADLSGKTVVITGGYAGIGLETTRALSSAGARIIAPARTPDKADDALAGLHVERVAMDLFEPDSVASGAEAIREAAPDGVDILINNAGVMATPQRRNSRGWECQFATNHLGHFALFAHLVDLLLQRPRPRVVALSSLAHRICDVELEDWNWERAEYHKWRAYGRSKSANALFALGLNARFEDRGLTAFSVHPGGIMTDLQRDMDRAEMIAMGWIDEAGTLNEAFKTPEQGAATSVWAATSPLLEGRGGVYCEDCNIAAPNPAEGVFGGVQSHVRDLETADKLWALSEAITGLSAR